MENSAAVVVSNKGTAQLNSTALISPFSSPECFEISQRMAKCLASSSLIPDSFHQNISNCMIALELAARFNYSPFLIMQNLYVIHGRPGFSSQFVIAAIQGCGRYSALHYRWTTDKNGNKIGCRAEATELATGEVLTGAEVTLDMAKREGWATKNGSKWATMPEQMLMYRAASFFGRLYAPDILLGMRSEDELNDAYGTGTTGANRGKINAEFEPDKSPSVTAKLNTMVEDAETVETVEAAESEVVEAKDEPAQEEPKVAVDESEETSTLPFEMDDKPAANSKARGTK